MINNLDIKNLVESLLNEIAGDFGYDKIFKGDVSVYNHEWAQRWFGEPIVPFCLMPTSSEPLNDGLGSVRNRYTLYVMAFSHDKQISLQIIDTLAQEFSKNENISIRDYKLSFEPYIQQYGIDFSEGSGNAFQRFDISLDFSVDANNNVFNTKDIVFTIDNRDVAVNSIRYTHGKTNYINKVYNERGVSGEHQKNLNTNELVVEAFVMDDTIVSDIMQSEQKVNIAYGIGLSIGGVDIINGDVYRLDGFEFSNTRNNIATVFLYFSIATETLKIKIDETEIPILDYAISTSVHSSPETTYGTPSVKNVYLGNRTTAYSFNISEDDRYSTVLEKLYRLLMDDGPESPFVDVEFDFRENPITKRLMIVGISKQNNNSAFSIIRVDFVEGGSF